MISGSSSNGWIFSGEHNCKDGKGVDSEVGVGEPIFWTIVVEVRAAVGGGMVSTGSVDFISRVI